MIERVNSTIACHGMLRRGRRIAVAVSGGADSIFLLQALHELSLAHVVLHVNHGLRGAESDGDEAFVRDLAIHYALPVHVLVVPEITGNTEQEARRFRYQFFTEHIEAGNCDAVATGHTLDDQAETVLYRFLRGSGTAGLSGIRPVTTSGIVRPLIALRREEIRSWLAERNMHWREDRSNADSAYLRNRIRLRLMPELVASLNPSLPEVLASTASWAHAEEDYWSIELDRLQAHHLITTQETVLIQAKLLLELPVAVQRRLLRRAIEYVRGSLRSIDFRHVEAIRSLMSTQEGSGRIQLPDLDIYRSFDWLRLAPIGFDSRQERDFEAPLLVPGRTEVASRQLAIDMELVSTERVYNDEVEGLDWERCAGSLVLRNWRPGDQFHRRGRPAAEKIKTLFQEFRVPLWERRRWPVIARGSSILWTRRFGVARDFAAGPGSGRILVVREVTESNLARATSMQVSMEMKRARDRQFRRSDEPGAEVL